MKKCPPSVICFENTTLLVFLILLCLILSFLYFQFPINTSSSPSPHAFNNYTNVITQKEENNDIFSNPYVAPHKNYFPPTFTNMNRYSTSSSFQQMGFLINPNQNNSPIALLGRPIQTNRDKWQYYCITDQYNSIKVPFLFRGKNSMNEYGCNELSNDDEVTLIGTKEKCKVTLYDNY